MHRAGILDSRADRRRRRLERHAAFRAGRRLRRGNARAHGTNVGVSSRFGCSMRSRMIVIGMVTAAGGSATEISRRVDLEFFTAMCAAEHVGLAPVLGTVLCRFRINPHAADRICGNGLACRVSSMVHRFTLCSSSVLLVPTIYVFLARADLRRPGALDIGEHSPDLLI